ncbi:MAG: TIM-barrel domain-containing protein [Flavonifractor plautii]
MIEQATPFGDGEGANTVSHPPGGLGNSLLLDFTNPDAVDWWMSKRAYLFDDIGIDGFKTDGGEMVWGRNTSFYDGSDGLEMRNEYPNAYIEAYYDFTEENTGTGMTLQPRRHRRRPVHRAYSGLADQSSTFDALQRFDQRRFKC